MTMILDDASLLSSLKSQRGMQSLQNTHDERVNLPLHPFTHMLYQFSCLQLYT